MQRHATGALVLPGPGLEPVGVEEHRELSCHETMAAQLLAGMHRVLGDRAHQRATDEADDRMRWAKALAIERLHGKYGPRWIAERIGALAVLGDMAGVERFRQIARRYERLIATRPGDGITTRS